MFLFDLLPPEIICEIIRLLKTHTNICKFALTNKRIFRIYRKNERFIFPRCLLMRRANLDLYNKGVIREIENNGKFFKHEVFTFKLNRYYGRKKKTIYYDEIKKEKFGSFYIQIEYYYYKEKLTNVYISNFIRKNGKKAKVLSYILEPNLKRVELYYLLFKELKNFEKGFNGFYRRKLNIDSKNKKSS